MDSYVVRAVDGWELGVRQLEPVGEPVGAALLLHAMMVDGRSFDRPAGAGLAATLAAAGFSVHVADLRGRGLSGPPVRGGGSWTYDDLVLRDVPALVAAARERSVGPRWVVGHSLGAHTSLAAAGIGAHAHPPHGHVLIAGNVWMPRLDGSVRIRARKHLAMRLMRRVGRTVGHFPSRRLRVGPVDEAGPYVADLCRFWFDDAWTSADGGLDYLAGLPSVGGPVLAVTSQRDSLFAHVEGARSFVEALGPGRADFWFVRDGDHGLTHAPGHMTLVTAGSSRPIWQAIADWMLRNP